MKKGQELTLKIESLAYGAKGVARFEDFVIFVDGAVPGQTVQARIYKKRKNHAQARIVEVVEESPFVCPAPCRHFGECGGCSLQHFDYRQQLLAKKQQVFDALTKLGGLDGFEIEETLASPHVFGYRNKMEFSFSRQRWINRDEIDSGAEINKDGLFLGMHARGFFEKIIDLRECHLVPPLAARVLDRVRRIAIASGKPAYTTNDHSGFWRFLVFRVCHNTDDVMVNVVTSTYDREIEAMLKDELTSAFPEITSLLYSTTTNKANVAFTEKEFLLAGKSTIAEKLGDYRFQISANSFFQTNTRQAERLYDLVADYAGFKGTENVYDLYCGAGTISLYISSQVKSVVGFEAVESAVKDANRNAELNNVENCRFVLGDLRDQLLDTEEVKTKYGEPDVMIIDPPRAGMHRKTVQAVLALSPPKIVHVSCNPTTLARDLKELCAESYRLVKVRAVDMFPHTAHVEVVALLEKNQ